MAHSPVFCRSRGGWAAAAAGGVGDRPGVNGAGGEVADKSPFICPGAIKKLSKNGNSA